MREVEHKTETMSEQELQQLIEQLKQENFQLREIINNVPGDVYWKNTDGLWLGVNARGTSSLQKMGLSSNPQDLIGKTDVDIFGEEIGNKYRENDQQVMQEKREISTEEIAALPSGEKITQLSIKRPLYNSSREIVGVIGNTVDITYLKNIENSLREAKDRAETANKAKTEFLENMRHDIRTPLVGIIGFASLIEEEINNPKIKEYMGNLVASSYALLDLLNEILEIIKISSGELPLMKKKFALKKRLCDVIQLNQAKANHKKLDLIYEYDESIPPYLIGDPTRVHRIALELITNALNFTDKGSVKLKVQLAEIHERDLIIKLIIDDTGIGIEYEKQQDIFLQFKRLSPSYDGVYKGAGLGLTIVKQFIDELQGEIYIDSQIGVGTKFTCIIPLKKALLDEGFGSDEPPVTSARKKHSQLIHNNPIEHLGNKKVPLAKNHVLVVEDQPIAAQIVANMLSNLGCTVEFATDGKIAIERIEKIEYDLIFMDIGLPELDGYETTRRIRLYELSKGTHVPIIALTAHVDDENKQKCLDVGMNAVISKPLTKEKAEEILNTFIAYRKEPREDNTIQEIIFSPVEGQIIDIHMMKSIVGGKEELIDEMLNLLVDSFPTELQALELFYKSGDWSAIQDIAHKLKGGASYCGTVRLKAASAQLERCIKSRRNDLYVSCYKQLLTEMASVEEAVKSKDYS